MIRWSTALASLVVFAACASAQIHIDRRDVAIQGYDVVAYFTDHRAVRGSTEHEVVWEGATWRFASAAHASTFRAAPDRYAPEYGGFCAYAMARGERVRIDPEAWSIAGGKLYLNYSLSVRTRWSEDRADYIRDADRHWAEMLRGSR